MSVEANSADRDASHTAPDAPVEQEDQRTLLCHNCAQLDFGKIRQQKVEDDRNGDHVMDLGYSTSLLESNCPLCQLFGATIQYESEVHLRIYQASLGSSGETRSNMLGVATKSGFRTEHSLYTKGYLAIESNQGDTRSYNTRLVNPGAFKLDIARRCWEYCSSNHVATCGRTSAYHSYPFKVIDCLLRTIIDAPEHCQYAALSYTWGNVSSTTHTVSSDYQEENLSLSNLPKTIEDSILVTLGMSLRYLWVDRYCINQFDHGAKDHQIKQMDAIYSLAELTIVAAAGDSPHHGLPGINGTQRNPQQQSIRLGEYCIRQTLPSAKYSLSSSIWSTRAWTYQEFILSRRRLVFTSNQVFYECQEMLCSESLNLPLDTAMQIYSDEDPKKPWSIVRLWHPLIRPSRITARPNEGILSLWECIEECSKRKLSFYEDTLNAMRGILKAAQRGNQTVYNLSGLPVLEPGFDMDATQQLLANLNWRYSSIRKRVTTLPSWSWAGWYGFGLFKPLLRSYQMSPTLENVIDSTGAASCFQSFDNEKFKGVVWIENQESLIEYPSNKTSAVELLTSLDDIRFIHIRTWVIPCRVAVVAERLSTSYSVTFMFKQHEFTRHFVLLSRKMTASDLERFRQERGSLLGMVLPEVFGQGTMSVLLVEEMGGHYERLGLIYIYGDVDDKGVKYTQRDLVSGLASEPKRTIRLG